MEELELEEEALFINQEMLTEVKDLIDDINDINDIKLSYLRQFIHSQWGSILGNENDIRIAVLKDELERWQNGDGTTYPYGYVGDMLKKRIKELIKDKI